MSTPGKTRQKAYRQRMQESGCRQATVWLNDDAYTALQLLVKSQQADASTVTSDALRYYHAVTSNKLAITSDSALVTSDVTGDSKPVTSDKPSRYMSQALEDHILALRRAGLSLSAVARQLADEGYLNAKGKFYDTSTVSKAETRAQRRK